MYDNNSKHRFRNPRLGEAVFIWTGNRLEVGRIVRIDASQSRHRFAKKNALSRVNLLTTALQPVKGSPSP